MRKEEIRVELYINFVGVRKFLLRRYDIQSFFRFLYYNILYYKKKDILEK